MGIRKETNDENSERRDINKRNERVEQKESPLDGIPRGHVFHTSHVSVDHPRDLYDQIRPQGTSSSTVGRLSPIRGLHLSSPLVFFRFRPVCRVIK